MTLKFFDADSSSGNGSLEFLNDWLIENPKNKKLEFLITEVKRAQSDKGYLVSTTDFNVFMWKKSKVCRMLVEALDHYIKESQYGFELFVVLKKPTKSDYAIAADTDSKITWFTTKNGFTTLESDASSVVEGESEINPLIPTIP